MTSVNLPSHAGPLRAPSAEPSQAKQSVAMSRSLPRSRPHTTRYAPVVLHAWQATQRGHTVPLNNAWQALAPRQQRWLDELGCTPQAWDAMQRGDHSALPPCFSKTFSQLSTPQQLLAMQLGLDGATWDANVAMRRTLDAAPKVAQAFAALRRAEQTVGAADVSTLLRAARGPMGLPSRAGQRALACLRDRFGSAFTPEARRRLDAAVNQRVPFVFHSHGWKTSVVPTVVASERRRVRQGGAPMVNDAGGMAAALVPDRVSPESVQGLREELLRAEHMGWQVNVTGARHSQGGQTCVGGALSLDMSRMRRVAPQDDDTVWAEAGATWHDVIAGLQGSGRTVQIMQASHIFSVGGSVAVNCHGRTPNDGPLITSLQALRVLMPDGRHITCSREHHAEIFYKAIGGYGMAGIVTEAQLRTVPDNFLAMRSASCPQDELPACIAAAVVDPDNEIAYARLDPALRGDGMITVARRAPELEANHHRGMDFERLNLTTLERIIFTISKWSSAFLGLRWKLERLLRNAASFGHRSELLDLNADGLRQLPWREGHNTDFLEELFVPFDAHAQGDAVRTRDQRFHDFTAGLRRLQQKHHWASLNITVRHVRGETQSALPYARQDSLAFVLYYNQTITAGAARRRAALQRDLADLSLGHGGSFYLCYQQSFTKEQIAMAYPELKDLRAFKAQNDPRNVLASSLGNGDSASPLAT